MCFSDICQAIILIFFVAIHLKRFMNKKEKKSITYKHALCSYSDLRVLIAPVRPNSSYLINSRCKTSLTYTIFKKFGTLTLRIVTSTTLFFTNFPCCSTICYTSVVRKFLPCGAAVTWTWAGFCWPQTTPVTSGFHGRVASGQAALAQQHPTNSLNPSGLPKQGKRIQCWMSPDPIL